MSLTPNLNLEKPDYKSPRYDIPINANSDILDAYIGQNVSPTASPTHKNLILAGDGSVTVTASSHADDLVIRGNAGQNTGMSILTPNGETSQIRFGTQNDDTTALFYASTTVLHFGTRSADADVEIGVGSNGNIAVTFKSTRTVNMAFTATYRNYSSQAAAVTAGLVHGDIYHTDGDLKIVY